jgi:SAM-dependent methyltransferase
MTGPTSDTRFAGAVPKAYETYLVPLLFEPYAADLAGRVAALAPANVLEIAAGTGVVTRALASRLPPSVSIVATDLNPPMLAEAEAIGTSRPVEWRPADAMALPFADATRDVVVCQFGAMFFPNKATAFAEALRVLRPGGTFLFSVWTGLADNELADEVQSALTSVFPEDPPRFLERLPHGYLGRERIEKDVSAGGFTASPRIEVLTLRSRARSARDAAVAYCLGTPLRNEIESRDATRLDAAMAACTSAIAVRFGSGEIDAKMQALVIAVPKTAR